MLNLDHIVNQTEEIMIFGETVHVKQPTIRMVMEIKRIEADMDRSNLWEKRLEVAYLLMNNNAEGREYTKDELCGLSITAIEALVVTISEMKIKADKDPNFRSPSRKGRRGA